MELVLRDYQHEAVQKVYEGYKNKIRRQLISLPTGTGKTIVAASIASHWNGPILFLAHREELIDQAAHAFKKVKPSWRIGIEQAGRSAEDECDVIIASVPTIGRSNSTRLSKAVFKPEQKWLIITDEAHHATASTYRSIYEHFDVLPEQEIKGVDNEGNRPQDGTYGRISRKLHIGITATPKRSDNIGLNNVYDKIIFKKNILQMINAGWLTDIKTSILKSGTNLDGVSIRQGDYAIGELSNKVNTRKRNDLVVNSYKIKAPEKKALVFCVDVQHVQDMTERFRDHDIQAQYIVGSTPPAERRSIIDLFRHGDVPVLVGCEVFTEGFDVPDIESIILARPTKSSLLYIQMIGRGLRPAKDKNHLALIDVTDNSRRHPAVSINSLLGLPIKLNIDGETVMHAVNFYREVAENARVDNPAGIIDALGEMTIDQLKEHLESVDIFKISSIIARKGIPLELQGLTQFTWFTEGEERYGLFVKEFGKFVIVGNAIGKWSLWLREVKEDIYERNWENIFEHEELSQVLTHADRIIGRQQTSVLYNIHASWRKKPASQKQVELLKSRGIPLPDELNKGEASLILDAVFRNSI